MAVRLSILDRAVLTRDDVEVRLEPRFVAVLIRLSLELGRNVTRASLYADALPPKRRSPGFHHDRVIDADEAERLRRAHVHKAISALRRALDPERPGEESVLLVTDLGANPGYRLQLDPECVDLLQFERMVAESRSLPPIRAARHLEQALALWRGRPLIDVAHHEWARRRVEQVTETVREARQRLLDLCLRLGQIDRALAVGHELLAEYPDPELEARLRMLKHESRPAEGLRRGLTLGPGNDVVVSVNYGDLLAQDDAHLVVGFSDAFETDTTENFLVNRDSLQGQLVHRLWGGDFKRLDNDLRAALRGVPHTSYRRAEKRWGKLWRFEIGTVATLRHDGRHIFAVAYSRVGPDGVLTRSSLAELRRSLDNVWAQVRQRGQFRPVALPVVGTGLARIDGVQYVDGIRVVLESFFAQARQGRLTDELRILIRPSDEDKVDLDQVAALIDELAPQLSGERV